MALKIDTGESTVTRSDVYGIAPSAFVVLDWGDSGRKDRDPAAITAMANDIRKNSQLQPVLARRLPDKRVAMVAGYTRLLAGLEIEKTDPKFRLMTRIEDGISAEDAFLYTLRENLLRSETTHVDDALNVRRLMSPAYGWSRKEAAEFYNVSVTHISNLMKLLTLPAAVQRKVAQEKLGLAAAVELAKVPEDQREDALKEALEGGDDTKRVKGAKLAAAARRRGVTVARGVSDLRKVLAGRTDTLSLALVAFLAGDGVPDDLTAALDVADEVANGDATYQGVGEDALASVSYETETELVEA